MRVVVSPDKLSAGSQVFTITNAGAVEHELLVFKSDLAASAYPLKSPGTLNEEAPGVTKISDGDNLKAGQSVTRTIDLSKSGKYLFVCNLPGHFGAGMYQEVVIR